jgi:5-formyltetrahydrofolate cyclo-ligase
VTDSRAILRRQHRERRAALPAPARIQAAEAMARHLEALPALGSPGYVAGYWAVGGEMSLHAVLHRLSNGAVYCLPMLMRDGRLRFAPWRPGDELVPNRFGIPEPAVSASSTLAPEDLAVALVPLVAFDAHGHRLGAGGGWYDRSFSFRLSRSSAPSPLLVGVGYEAQREPRLAAEPWDVGMDMLATEAGLFAAIPTAD